MKRAFISNKLRKEGNHSYSIENNEVVIPTKRSSIKDPITTSGDIHVDCKFCFGFYKKKYFYLQLKSREKFLLSQSFNHYTSR